MPTEPNAMAAVLRRALPAVERLAVMIREQADRETDWKAAENGHVKALWADEIADDVRRVIADFDKEAAR